MTILVTGATGRVGSRFVPRLLQQQAQPVRVLARDPVRAEPLGRLGAEVVVADVLSPVSRVTTSSCAMRWFDFTAADQPQRRGSGL